MAQEIPSTAIGRRPVIMAIGQSGSGKSTLLNKLGGLLPPLIRSDDAAYFYPSTSAVDGTTRLKSVPCRWLGVGRDVVLVDCPGFNSPTKRDAEYKKQIADALYNIATFGGEIQAILLVVDGNEERMHDSMQEMLLSIETFFSKGGQRIWPSVVIVFSQMDKFGLLAARAKEKQHLEQWVPYLQGQYPDPTNPRMFLGPSVSLSVTAKDKLAVVHIGTLDEASEYCGDARFAQLLGAIDSRPPFRNKVLCDMAREIESGRLEEAQRIANSWIGNFFSWVAANWAMIVNEAPHAVARTAADAYETGARVQKWLETVGEHIGGMDIGGMVAGQLASKCAVQ